MLQAAKQELTRQFNAAERERKSRKKSAAEVAQEQREFEIRKKQQVKALRAYVCLRHLCSYVTHCMTVQPCSFCPHVANAIAAAMAGKTSLALHVPSSALKVNFGKYLLLVLQEQLAEAARIAAERTRLQQEQAAAARLHSEQKKRMREDQLRQKQLQQVILTRCSVSCNCSVLLDVLCGHLVQLQKTDSCAVCGGT